ncbi:MAG: hypothetical protein JNK46_07415 [Methylobacteriaceae bacterium]|nr:hypothetical protein [Methylobacteriaceae bacterium]
MRGAALTARYRALAVVAFAVASLAAGAARAEDYGVFCAASRIEVDSRSNEEMRTQRGACSLGRFGTRTEAENFARRNFGGVRSSCSCR